MDQGELKIKRTFFSSKCLSISIHDEMKDNVNKISLILMIASVVKIYSATNSMARFRIKIILL
jgi:hypothetical protein